MNKTRRGFLGALAAMVAAPVVAELDPEKLLWVPGAKLISIPKPTGGAFLVPEFISAEVLKILRNNLIFAKINAEYEQDLNFISGTQWLMPIKRIGDTITVRKPQRYFS